MKEGDRQLVLSCLDRVLATGLVCMVRCWRHLEAAGDVYPMEIRRQFVEQVRTEARHAELVACRIIELGGVPDLRTETLAQRSMIGCNVDHDDPREIFLPNLIESDLVAQQIVADACSELIDDLVCKDPATCRMLATIVSDEHLHVGRLSGLLHSVCEPVEA
jgi:bacterioferritin